MKTNRQPEECFCCAATEHNKTIRHIPFVFLLILSAVIMNACGIIDLMSVVNYNRAVTRAPFDAVIIPGNSFDSLITNRIFRARIFWAVDLYRQGVTRNLIFSGAAVHTPYQEGMAMEIIADSLGVPMGHTFFEPQALHSKENVDYGIAMARSLGFTNVAIATDPIQAIYLGKYLRQTKQNISVLSFPLDSMKTYNRPIPKVNVRIAYVPGFIPLKQREPMASAMLRFPR